MFDLVKLKTMQIMYRVKNNCFQTVVLRMFRTPRVRTNVGSRSVSVQGLNMWNCSD